MKALDRSGLCNTYEASTPTRTSRTPLEMPDLESIIREFEMGFLSPSKQDVAADGSKQKNFVKKIVAAFEVKYKGYNDMKTAYEARESAEESKLDIAIGETSKRRSGIFTPFKSSSDEGRPCGKLDDSPMSKGNREDVSEISENSTPSNNRSGSSKRRPRIFGSPFKISSDEDGDNFDDSSQPNEEETKNANRKTEIFVTPSKDKTFNLKSAGKSGIFLSPFNRSNCKNTSRSSSEIYTSPVNIERRDSKDSSSDCSSLFKFGKEESSRRSNFHFDLLKVSSHDDTKTMDDIGLDVTLPEPEETILLDENTLPKTSTMINEFANEGDDSVVTVSSVDKTPKIVGAFLKKPIEVEDTSIDWIPITGKKLPRKRSLKKLLYSLAGKKFEKKSKLFSSERNLNEESREFQDSGYDERSCSSSSLTSLISITEVLLQQENTYVEPERRRTTLSTFRSRNSLDEEEDEAFCDAYRCTGRKLLLTEVPRKDVKLDLGPSYPPSYKMVTMSLDRKTVPRKTCSSPPPVGVPLRKIPKHPFLSKIPKHPFVALTKMDEPQEFQNAQVCRTSQEPLVIIKNDLYEVEFRRSCDDICSSNSCRSSSSAASQYDVPRRFLSKSEPEISSICQSQPIRREKTSEYDVPNSQPIERPRSSVFEDALSLKRRSVNLGDPTTSNYAVPRDLGSPYATIKPRNTRIYLNNETLRSFNDLTSMEKSSAL
ncbi:hypothetical protein WH47_12778 [Habropoda laboriosa]|uniref:Uncharacterized protein n=1 Tax=Habropoda laboriosa TaxID=597456 RepID=A0A0L7R580_9HYME|nr:hypothetical protein WH47_12778 [Habropoda laboriosa]